MGGEGLEAECTKEKCSRLGGSSALCHVCKLTATRLRTENDRCRCCVASALSFAIKSDDDLVGHCPTYHPRLCQFPFFLAGQRFGVRVGAVMQLAFHGFAPSATGVGVTIDT